MPRRTVLMAWVVVALLGGNLVGQTTPVRYIYDEVGRLVGVVDQNGDAAYYHYDLVGNLTSITRTTSAQVAIIEFTPNQGPIGQSVTIYGTGFSATPGSNTVTFNGTSATVSSATVNKLVVTVPSGATTGTIAVTSPNGSASSADSFSVGSAVGAPAITGISPTIGVAGTSVTITGTGFDAAVSKNNVNLNVSYTLPTSATSTQIVAPAPVGATSGHVTVSNVRGSAVSSQDFFVAPSPYTASDVLVTDRMLFAQDKVVSMSTASKIGLVLFDATAGQRASLKVSSVTITSVDVKILDPYGRIVGSLTAGTSGGFIEPFKAAVSGTYTVLVDPASTNTGNLTLRLTDVPADLSGTITAGGSAVSVSISAMGQNGRWTFSGSANDEVSLRLSSVTFPAVYISILSPDGTLLAGPTITSFIDKTVLPVTGTYTAVVDPSSTSTGSATLNVYNAADVTGTITIGGSTVTPTITSPGQNAILTFSGTAAQRISLAIGAGPSGTVKILKPDTTVLASGSINVIATFLDTTVLPTTGTYSITVDPMGTGTGGVALTLYQVAADVSGAITPGGFAVTVSITSPGQNGLLTFSGTSGQRVSLGVSSGPGGTVTIRKPDDTTLTSGSIQVIASFIEAVTLPTTGTYSIFVNPTGSSTGSVTLTLYDVPADVTGSVTVGGSALGVTTTVAGQNASVTFSGTASQQVTVHVTNNAMGFVTVKLLKADGTVLTSASSSGANFNLSTQTLPATATYTISIDPSQANTGSLNVNVTNP